mgnify:FL=1
MAMTINAGCDGKDRLLAYLYDEVTTDERQAFEGHLAACAACRRELEDLSGVRGQLASWTPPEQELGVRIVRDEPARIARPWWRAPAWGLGLAAAAVVVLAAGAAVANLEVRYDEHGVTVRTGWRSPAAPDAPVTTGAAAPWRADLQALEERLRADVASSTSGASAQTAAAESAPAPAVREAAVLRRVSALVRESEERQRRELALRMTDVVRDVDWQRRTDWVRIQQGFGRLEEVTGAGVAQQREMMNYLMRVSQRNPR